MRGIDQMTLGEVRGFVRRNKGKLTDEQLIKVKDRLANILWGIGITWDDAMGVDPKMFCGPRGSTKNHRSMTYKLRKIAGYSYP